MTLVACGGGSNCEYPQVDPRDGGNDVRCPPSYGGPQHDLCAGTSKACSAPGLVCSYYGVGDGTADCHAIAMMTCSADSKWICTQ